MDEDDPTDEISRIEARLEELAETSERCRKIILVSKVAIAGGVTLLLVTMLGLFGSNAVAALGSIAVVLGGIDRSDRTSAPCNRQWPPSAPPRCSVRI